MTKKSPHDPVGQNPFKKDLKSIKDKLVAEEDARKAEALARQEAAKARGEREPTKRPGVPAPPPAKKSAQVEVWRPDMEKRLFEVAMSGITPLTPKGAGRVSNHDVSSRVTKRSPEVSARQRLAEGGPSLAVEWAPDGTVRGAHKGREFALEAIGRFATSEDSLDLHGLEPMTAKLRVAEFVRTRRARGMRCVRVITGYGKTSPDGASVLIDAVVDELRRAPTSGEIDAFASAPDDLGGRGAIVISIRH